MLHNTGEEAILRDFFAEDITKPSGVTVGLYLAGEEGNELVDASDVGDITTEPEGSAYERQTASFGAGFTIDVDGSDNARSSVDDLTFDTTDSTVSVNAYFVVFEFVSSRAGDAVAEPHLLWTGDLDQTSDLDLQDEYVLQGGSLALD